MLHSIYDNAIVDERAIVIGQALKYNKTLLVLL